MFENVIMIMSFVFSGPMVYGTCYGPVTQGDKLKEMGLAGNLKDVILIENDIYNPFYI